MATAADIGASFSNYQGNAGLGEINGSPINIDTRPLQQLAIYTNLYNKSLWDQQQIDTNNKIDQLAKLSEVNVASLHGKDRDEFGKIWSSFLKDASDYARKMPQTPEEKVQQQLDWQVKLGRVAGLYNTAKQRSISYLANLNTIATSDSNPERQTEQIKELNRDFDNSSLTTPLTAMAQYKMQNFDVPDPVPSKFNSVAVTGNEDLDIEGTIYNPKVNDGIASATILGLRKAYVPQTIKDENGNDVPNPDFSSLSTNQQDQASQQNAVPSEANGWVNAVQPFNAIRKNYVDDKGNFDAEKFENDNASNTTIMNAYNALKKYNADNRNRYNEAVNGFFDDKGISIPLPQNVNPEDFKVGFVDFSKPITPNQLLQSGMYAKYSGDTFQKKVTHTGDQRAMDIAKMNRASSERIAAGTQAGENYRKRLDLIGKGWEIDAKGKLKPPTKTSTTAADNGGIVPYWQNYIVPQIQSTKGQMERTTGKTGGIFGFFQKDVKEAIPNDFTGDVDVAPDKISGLSVALLGEKTADGKQKGISGHGEDPTSISVRFDKGNPIGVVIDGVFYDQNDINSKATQLNDKTVSNKTDSPIFDNSDNSGDEQTQQSVPKLTDAQKYLQSLKSK